MKPVPVGWVTVALKTNAVALIGTDASRPDGDRSATPFGPRPTPQPVVIPTLQPPPPTFVFPEKQTLTFTVDWRVFTAGTAVFQLEQQGTVQKITATADTVGAVTMLFPPVHVM